MNFNLKHVDTSDYKLRIVPKFGVESLKNVTALLTDAGILILDLNLNAESSHSIITHHKLFIHPERYMIIEHLDIDPSRFLFDLPQDAVYKCLLHEMLVGCMENIKKKRFHITQCRMSPEGLFGKENLLSAITDGGALDVYVKVNSINTITKYEHVFNMNEFHITRYKHLWIDCKQQKPMKQYEGAIERLKLHTPLAMAWTHLMTHKSVIPKKYLINVTYKYVVLIVAYADGRIVFWQMNQISIETYKEAKVAFLGEFMSNMEDITILHWHPSNSSSGLLLIGNKKGEIVAVPIKQLTALNFQLGESIILSKSNEMSVEHLSTDIKGEHLLIYGVCQTYWFIFAMNQQGNIVHSIAYNVSNLNITGLQKTVNSTILLTTTTGAMKEVQITIVNDKIKIENRDILVDIDWRKNSLCGAFMSQNNAIVTLITQLSRITYKESYKLTLSNFVDTSVDAFQKFMDNEWICDSFDLLEALRVISLQNKVLLSSKIPNDVDYDVLPLAQLKKYFFVAKITEAVYDKVESITDYTIKTSSDIRNMIMIKFAIYLLQDIVAELKQQSSVLSFKQEVAHCAVSFLKEIVYQDFLEEHNLKTNYVNEILTVLNDCDDFNLYENKICRICEGHLCSSSCMSGHVDNRCALTMVQIIHSKYKCVVCTHYVSEEAILFNKQMLCPICDSTLDTIYGSVKPFTEVNTCYEDCLSNIV